MAMTKKAGSNLEFGIQSVQDCVAQSGSRTAGGELKTYRDEQGNYLALYLDDDHTEIQFEGILRQGQAANKKKGDKLTVFGISGYITDWKVQWQNDDVAKVSGSLRDYAGLS